MPAKSSAKGKKIGRKRLRSAAQQRYRAACGGRGRCYGRKVNNLMRHNGMTRTSAERFMSDVYRKRGQSKTPADQDH